MVFETEGKKLCFKIGSGFYTIFSIKNPFLLKNFSRDEKDSLV